ncbi:hypothetical protein GCM10009547_21340 [Sporichthya brevicatena]|uniref:DUF308 domain-containing protein n=1 Tax=Sporichthya brevicatena TaxID=171442 RepID=A0ABP3RVV9_9ACTN
MSTPHRTNGLSAERWVPLVDLEPQLADALLEALREEGVAAYASPAPGVRGPYMDIQLPNRPTDRVFVDAGAAGAARAVLDARRDEFGPGDVPPPDSSSPATAPATAPDAAPPDVVPPGSAAGTAAEEDGQDFDAAWRAIVAGYGQTSTEQQPVAPWSPAEDVEPDAPSASGSWRVLRRGEGRGEGEDEDPDAAWGLPGGASTPEEPEPAEPEEHYVPPPPPPLPRMDLQTKLSWLGVVGGPILLVLFTSLDWYPIEGATFLAIAAFVGGFASLVYRMKDDGPDDGDNGAVV